MLYKYKHSDFVHFVAELLDYLVGINFKQSFNFNNRPDVDFISCLKDMSCSLRGLIFSVLFIHRTDRTINR